jgi:hypothetical protein
MDMSTKIAVNKPVNVTAVYFNNQKDIGLREFPKRIEFDGDTYTFLNSGLQYLIKKGRSVVRIFDMTDGTANYRLRQEGDESRWTLVAITRSA